MKLLFIAPIPDPINGQSKTSLMVLDSLGKNYICKIVNLSKNNLKNGFKSFGRLIEISLIFLKFGIIKKERI